MAEFKLIVAGGRDFADSRLLQETVLELANTRYRHREVSIVSGMAKGADALAYEFAMRHGIKAYKMPANWDKYGKGAGYRRNEDMGRMADGLLAFWDGKSKGTKNMIDIMQRHGKDVLVINY